MFLSVIVPTYNRNDLLLKCLNALSPDNQTIGQSSYEVIVSDDSLTSQARQLSPDFPWFRFVDGPKRGPAANRNNGAKQAKGDWLVFIDDDCIPDKTILQTYFNEIVLGNYQALEGLIDAERPQERFDEESPLNLNGGCFWSCNIAVSQKLFKSINGFDEGFPFAAMEDVDLYSRIKEVTNSKFLRDAKVIHPWRSVKPFRNFKKRVLSHRYILKKNNVKKGLNYRVKRFKLFIGQTFTDIAQLHKFSYKGAAVFFDRLCFHFVMLFV